MQWQCVLKVKDLKWRWCGLKVTALDLGGARLVLYCCKCVEIAGSAALLRCGIFGDKLLLVCLLFFEVYRAWIEQREIRDGRSDCCLHVETKRTQLLVLGSILG